MDTLTLKLKALSEQFAEETAGYRRFLHQHPELSGNERGTAVFVADKLRSFGLEPQMLLDDTAVCVLVEGRDPERRCVALRADMDALPIQEETGLPFASSQPGVMHACGHDAHTAMLLTVARLLHLTRDEWFGTVKLLFQPSEEQYPGGAIQLIEAGVLENPSVSAIIGCHVSPEIACGCIGYKPGPYMASTDEIHVTLHGKGGHAALPDTFVNPIGIAAEALVRLEKEFGKGQTGGNVAEGRALPLVCTFGRIEALGHTNVVPECAQLQGTLRTFDEARRVVAQGRIAEIFDAVATERHGQAEVRIAHGYPVLVNDPALSSRCAGFASSFLGDSKVLSLDYRTTADDFAYFSHRIPAFFYRLGVQIPDHPSRLHTSTFNLNEEVFAFAPALMAGMAVEVAG